MKLVCILLLLSALNVHTARILGAHSIEVDLSNLHDPWFSARGKTDEYGIWKIPISPQELKDIIDRVVPSSFPDLEAHIYSAKRWDKKAIKAILKKSTDIYVYQFSQEEYIKTQIVYYQKDDFPDINTLKNSLDNRVTICLIKNILTRSLSSPDIITYLRDHGTFPAESYFDDWQRYSLVYFTKKPVPKTGLKKRVMQLFSVNHL